MKFVPIFDIGNMPREDWPFWTVRFPNEPFNEFDKLFENWNDTSYLRTFFKENQEALDTDFFKTRGITPGKAALQVIEEAGRFEDDLLDIEDRIHNGEPNTIINELFYPYHLNEVAPLLLKGKARQPSLYLRLYALHLEDKEQIIIVGGGIKLTRAVQEGPHLVAEIEKAKRVRAYLKAEGIQFLD